MPRLVRRRPFLERLKANLNPLDFLLWLSEEIETRDWDAKRFGDPIGLALNFVFLLAKANTGTSGGNDDVFGDNSSGTGLVVWFATFIVHILTLVSVTNAVYTFIRKRHYRLFETSVDIAPSTPSAQRVRVDSTPVSSPLRLLASVIGKETAESRAHPDPTRDVWELAVWDPLPICMRFFCLFSPGHVLVYWLFLPIASSDITPSMTVITVVLLQVLLSAQLILVESNFTQQAKDTTIIHQQVLNEYDTKYVHPRLNGPVRDVGTQFNSRVPEPEIEVDNTVDTYTPATIIRRSFKINPNPNYAKHISPSDPSLVPKREVLNPKSAFSTPSQSRSQSYNTPGFTPFRTQHTAVRQPQFRASNGPTGVSTGTNTSDGGSLGVYSHANSPLKKATSMYDLQNTRRELPRNSAMAASREIAEDRERERSQSPIKRLKDEPSRRASGPSGLDFRGRSENAAPDFSHRSRGYY